MLDSQQLALFADQQPVHDAGCKRPIRLPDDVTVGTDFSPCQRYRYKLVHRWSFGPMLLWVMMNPSAASKTISDSTVETCGRISRRIGFAGQMIGNACAYRSTSPKGLLEVDDPVGPRNQAAILEMAAECKMVVIAHGRLPGRLQVHADTMCRLLIQAGHRLHVLRLSSEGVPMHPLARAKGFRTTTIEPVPWAGPGPEIRHGS